METIAYKSKNNPKTSLLPPRRGQIKPKVIREVFKFVKMAGKVGGKKGENGGGGGGCLSSTSTTPHATPSGHTSETHSDA
ncbi:uncharacterized protein LOC132310249 [Cornus florida]|uniref:uncharacterized protein LOC132310249 n=1 Tax=Cornus florida TaxID=4283 RepID=UPI002896F248|nr:uncharacterized protein LOC132310249 [Cornus florida]